MKCKAPLLRVAVKVKKRSGGTISEGVPEGIRKEWQRQNHIYHT